MEKIVAIIPPFQAEATKDALHEIGIPGITVTEVRRFGREEGRTTIHRGAEYVADWLPMVQLEMVVPDEAVSEVTDVILKTSYTGRMGDGKIFVLPVEEAHRVRTGERGDAALSSQ